MRNTIKHLCLVVLIAVFTSCKTVDHIKETVTVYRDTTIYRTDTIRVELPRDTVTIMDTVTIKDDFVFMPEKRFKVGLIGGSVSVAWSVLNIQAYLTDSTILQPVFDTIYIENAIQETTTTNTVVVKEKYVPWFHKATTKFFWLVVAGLSVWLAIKFGFGRLTKLVGRIKLF